MGAIIPGFWGGILSTIFATLGFVASLQKVIDLINFKNPFMCPLYIHMGYGGYITVAGFAIGMVGGILKSIAARKTVLLKAVEKE